MSDRRPNILLAISDDQSWRDAGAYGQATLRTPAFDRIAHEGTLFTHGYCPAPQCSPSRAALLTGRNIWQLEEAGTHDSLFPSKYDVYPELLKDVGYLIGYTGKPWGPGNWRDGGRLRNPAGEEYNEHKLTPPTSGISNCDYTANFRAFLNGRSEGQPFCFWFGCREPHRPYERDSGIGAGKLVEQCDVPTFLPDVDLVRRELLDYELEIEWFDDQLGQMVKILEDLGELDNTVVVVTSDNGMPFPHAKANLYEFGSRVPLAIRWGQGSGQVVDGLVSLIDLAPTILEAAGVAVPEEMAGRSLMGLLRGEESGTLWNKVLTGKERHNHARFDNVGYPCRAIRTPDFLYIQNFKPDRWPIGDPPGFFCHTKLANPTKDYILEHRDELEDLFQMTYAKRPVEELFRVEEDLGCIRNVVNEPDCADIRQDLVNTLNSVLQSQGDPRVLGYGDVFDSYPHYAPQQDIVGGFKQHGEYNPEYWRLAQDQSIRPLKQNK
ncbi:MAG: sulfatase, partial [Candidatus Latescibacteria bacterium]|nr:sulfatase [Candidatus Latescibacterota bacterium]